MLKMYHAQSNCGSSPEFWDANWDAASADLSNPRVCENDPCHSTIMMHARPARIFLEGGCGSGQWVKYLHDRNYRVVGVDFAPRTVDKVRNLIPDADVRVGDVCALPFGDGEVHTYFSGGVVEHFETGPELALREARRVIARDGWFLCSVPDESSLRRLLYRASTTDRPGLDPRLVVRKVSGTLEENAPEGTQFFQYAFSPHEFRQKLQAAGFAVVETFGYSLVWGLMEIPRFQQLHQYAFQAARFLRNRMHQAAPPPRTGSTDEKAAERLRSSNGGQLTEWLLRALVREDRATPLVGLALRVALEHCANMRMYVAQPV